jgi:hypothetical protein
MKSSMQDHPLTIRGLYQRGRQLFGSIASRFIASPSTIAGAGRSCPAAPVPLGPHTSVATDRAAPPRHSPRRVPSSRSSPLALCLATPTTVIQQQHERRRAHQHQGPPLPRRRPRDFSHLPYHPKRRPLS